MAKKNRRGILNQIVEETKEELLQEDVVEQEPLVVDLKAEAPEIQEELMAEEEIIAQEEYINEVPEEPCTCTEPCVCEEPCQDPCTCECEPVKMTFSIPVHELTEEEKQETLKKVKEMFSNVAEEPVEDVKVEEPVKEKPVVVEKPKTSYLSYKMSKRM